MKYILQIYNFSMILSVVIIVFIPPLIFINSTDTKVNLVIICFALILSVVTLEYLFKLFNKFIEEKLREHEIKVHNRVLRNITVMLRKDEVLITILKSDIPIVEDFSIIKDGKLIKSVIGMETVESKINEVLKLNKIEY